MGISLRILLRQQTATFAFKLVPFDIYTQRLKMFRGHPIINKEREFEAWECVAVGEKIRKSWATKEMRVLLETVRPPIL